MSVYVTPQPLPYFVGTNRELASRQPSSNGGPFRAFGSASPPDTATIDDAAVTLGVEFYVTSAVSLTTIYWWQATTSSDGSARTAGLFTTPDGTQVVSNVTGAAPSAPGWQAIPITPFALTPLTRYVAAVFHPLGRYSSSSNYFTTDGAGDGPLVIPPATSATNNEQGTFTYNATLAFPADAFNSSNYWVDVTVAYV